MTSKEKLRNIRCVLKGIENYSLVECDEWLNDIYDDLEVLDLLKKDNLLKHLIEKELFDTANSYCGNTNEEREKLKQYINKLNKIKEWLEK